MIGTIILGIISAGCFVISIMQFKEKGFLFNNAYITLIYAVVSSVLIDRNKLLPAGRNSVCYMAKSDIGF